MMIKNFIVIGISCYYHDSSAVLIKDGEIICAFQEERFTRKKFDNSFPFKSINHCLKYANIKIQDINSITYYEDPKLKLNRIIKSDLSFNKKKIFSNFNKIKDWFINKNNIPNIIKSEYPKFNGDLICFTHHYSHAASAFYPSPFVQSAILTMDGVGEWSTSTIGEGINNDIKLKLEERFPNSIGLFYSALTQFCGFKVLSGEYKLMGLAPYGESLYVKEMQDNLINVRNDGSIIMNQDYFNYTSGNNMITNKLSEIFKIDKRNENEIIQKKYMDIAASTQKVLENIILKKARYTLKITGQKNLCLAGGVALNCVANEKITKIENLDNIWVQPSAGDAGAALGAALAGYFYYNPKSDYRKNYTNIQKSSLLGQEYNNDVIKEILDNLNFNYNFYNNKDRDELIINKIIEQNVVGLFQGRMEFGPRALGSRSILADPRSQDMQKKLNLKIKFRESFRPFAPAILEEYFNEWFESEMKNSPYMLFTARVRKEKLNKVNINQYYGFDKLNANISKIPAVTHVDYSARVQTVSKKDNEKFYNLINCFYKKTGTPILINTSFNVRGEPIVNSPIDALQCFVNTNIDVLVLENYIIYKKDQKNVLLENNLNEIFPD